jgi:SAM-dependent methyltransferase
LYGVGRANTPSVGSSGGSINKDTTEIEYKRGESILNMLKPYLVPGASILDVGGNRGGLMEPFVERGYRCTVVDLNPEPPTSSKIKKVVCSFLEWDGKADVIVMSHILEHTADPNSFLEHAFNILPLGGALFVEVPFELLTPFVRRHLGDHRHLGYFTRTTMRSYLSKTGFKCIRLLLTIDLVGENPIPLIRTVALKVFNSNSSHKAKWKSSYIDPVRSFSDLLKPIPWLYRIRNKIIQLV